MSWGSHIPSCFLHLTIRFLSPMFSFRQLFIKLSARSFSSIKQIADTSRLLMVQMKNRLKWFNPVFAPVWFSFNLLQFLIDSLIVGSVSSQPPGAHFLLLLTISIIWVFLPLPDIFSLPLHVMEKQECSPNKMSFKRACSVFSARKSPQMFLGYNIL